MNYGYTEKEWDDIKAGKWNGRYFDVVKKHIEVDNIHMPHLLYLINLVERQQKEIQLLDSAIEDDDITKTRYATTIGELISLNLWSARRLHKTHKKFAYDELEKITGFKHERL
ncbi:hypothetical protein BAOM_3056 [Peribacillus asahii]|uniref:Uncharacterized protein n=1 Tax=Peribacillus asahii TaxID=228899 RepID=A0A3T0KTU1_9BACI|nr:hypothetical protein [Peribacillus asahii]AZV43665.1 hypothetical protein BAOM_3056 [Peribacillus asahii]